MKVERFEDLEAWQAARVLVSQVYDMTRQAQDTGRDYRFRDQITAAAVSVMSNIAEGFSRRTDREFAQFLFISKGSCAEVQSLLYVALDQNYTNKVSFQKIYAQAESVARLTSGLITYLLRGNTGRSKSPKSSVETRGQGITPASPTQPTQPTPRTP